MTIEIANHLAELRRKAGLSQEALADKLGLSRQAVSKWERAEAAPDIYNLIALARLYNISLDDLLLFRRGENAADTPDADDPDAHEDAPPHSPQNPEAPPLEPEDERFDENAIRMLNASYPVLMTALFFLMGFINGWWHPGWMLFLTIPLYYTLIPALRKRDHRIFAYPVALVLVYLIIGFLFDAWSWGWILFLTIPSYYAWKPGR